MIGRIMQIEEGDNTPPPPPDLHNSSYHTKAEFNNCFIIYSKYFQSLERQNLLRFGSVTNC